MGANIGLFLNKNQFVIQTPKVLQMRMPEKLITAFVIAHSGLQIHVTHKTGRVLSPTLI